MHVLLKRKLGVFSLCFFIGGCSVYSAAKAPDPVDYKRITTGSSRGEVISILGRPLYSDTKNNTVIDNFEFIDGNHAGSKSRIILYLAGDLFTAGLAEIIFWPLEEFALQGAEGKAIVEYDDQSRVRAISVFSKSNNESLYQISLPIEHKANSAEEISDIDNSSSSQSTAINPSIVEEQLPISEINDVQETLQQSDIISDTQVQDDFETTSNQLKTLKELKDADVLTDEEYEVKRKALVDKIQ